MQSSDNKSCTVALRRQHVQIRRMSGVRVSHAPWSRQMLRERKLCDEHHFSLSTQGAQKHHIQRTPTVPEENTAQTRGGRSTTTQHCVQMLRKYMTMASSSGQKAELVLIFEILPFFIFFQISPISTPTIPFATAGVMAMICRHPDDQE